jgi:hypothetical protein
VNDFVDDGQLGEVEVLLMGDLGVAHVQDLDVLLQLLHLSLQLSDGAGLLHHKELLLIVV